MVRKIELTLDSDFHPDHSEFQIENFIIGSDGNLWGRYKQVLRELAARHDGVVSEIDALRSLAAQVARLNGGGWNPINRKKRREKSALMRSQLLNRRKRFKPKIREYRIFYKLAIALKRKLGEIDTNKRKELERGFWIEKARKLAAIDLISTGRLQQPTVEFLIKLPRDIRKQILIDCRPENHHKLLSILE